MTFTANGKREIVLGDPNFLFTFRLMFSISTPEEVVSCYVHLSDIGQFLSVHFLIWENLNLQLTFAVCRLP